MPVFASCRQIKKDKRRAHEKYHLRRAGCLAAAFLFLGLTAGPARAAGEGDVVLKSSEQLFDVLAAINAAGYNYNLNVDTGDKTRAGVRDALAKEHIPVLPELKAFYSDHTAGLDGGEILGQYVSLALLLGPPPDFKPTLAAQDLPPDARSVAGFLPLLRDFYKQANLADLWARVESPFQAQVERYSNPARHTIELTDGYLRFPSGAYLGRTYTIYLDLLAAAGQVQGRIYRSDYYLVVAPSTNLRLSAIRYQYLHFLLDPLAVKFAADIEKTSGLLVIARKAPELGEDYRNDYSLLATECLIRAVELRMDKTPAAQAQKSVQKMAEAGFILVPYFYNALATFENQPAGMSDYFKTLMDGINPAAESAKLAGIKFSSPHPGQAAAPAPVKSKHDQMLDEADNDIYQGKYEEAKNLYTEILSKFSTRRPQAYYGIAVANSFLRKPDLAKEYFEKTLDSARDARLVTWSHIYLGRIADINGDRKAAVAQYRAASVTAAAYPEALRAVQQGLRAPFGSGQ